jgi:hypothetical protein
MPSNPCRLISLDDYDLSVLTGSPFAHLGGFVRKEAWLTNTAVAKTFITIVGGPLLRDVLQHA